jgi:hypothetical protein
MSDEKLILKFREIDPNEKECADSYYEQFIALMHVNAERQRCIDALRNARLAKHENVAGCLFTEGAHKQSEADIAAIKALDMRQEVQ